MANRQSDDGEEMLKPKQSGGCLPLGLILGGVLAVIAVVGLFAVKPGAPKLTEPPRPAQAEAPRAQTERSNRAPTALEMTVPPESAADLAQAPPREVAPSAPTTVVPVKLPPPPAPAAEPAPVPTPEAAKPDPAPQPTEPAPTPAPEPRKPTPRPAPTPAPEPAPQTPKPTPKPPEKPAPKPKPEPEPEPVVVKGNGVTMTVFSLKRKDSLGDIKLDKGYSIYAADVELVCDGNTTLKYAPKLFKLKDSKARESDASKKSFDGVLTSGALKKGGKVRGVVAFSAKSDAAGLTLSLLADGWAEPLVAKIPD